MIKLIKNSKIDILYGFTLIELMVVVVLFAVLATVGANFFSTILRGSNKVSSINQLKQNGSYAFGIMERFIRNAEMVMSTCDDGTNKLSSITILNPDNNQTTFDFSGGRIASVSAWPAPTPSFTFNLTDSSVVLLDVPNTSYFKCTSGNGTPEKIDIVFTLQPTNMSALPVDKKATVQFQTTISLRNY